MCISPTNMHWRERPTNSGQKSLEKEELFTLEENLRWTSASSARLFLSWAQASPSVLEEEKDNDQCPVSCPSSLVGSVRQTWHNTLYHILISKIMEKGDRNPRKQPTFVTKAEFFWHCMRQIFENKVHHDQRGQSLHQQNPSVSYPYHNKAPTNAVFPLPLLLYTLLQRTDFHFRWKASEKFFSTWKFLHCLLLLDRLFPRQWQLRHAPPHPSTTAWTPLKAS